MVYYLETIYILVLKLDKDIIKSKLLYLIILLMRNINVHSLSYPY